MDPSESDRSHGRRDVDDHDLMRELAQERDLASRGDGNFPDAGAARCRWVWLNAV
jgi:hypothetical protein